MPNVKSGRLIAAIVVLVGAILLIAALFMPWYMEKLSTTGASSTANAYPGFPSQNGTIQYTCSGYLTSCPQTSYNNAHLNNTAVIAETGFFLLIVGFICGILGALVGFMARGNSSRVRPAMVLSILALIFAIVTPLLFAVALPGAQASDTPTAARFGASSGPWSSFIGSSTGTIGTTSISLNWGPAVGWYLSIVAFVLLLVGVILLMRARHDPSPAPTSMPAPGTPAMAPPQ